MKKSTSLFLAVSGFLPVLGALGSPPDLTLLIYSLFVLALFLRRRANWFAHHAWPRPPLTLALLIIGSGLVAECFAWTSHFLARSAQPALLHPQLIPDLILGVGFYGGWAAAWILALRRYRFSLASVFVTSGCSGILMEAVGQVLFSILRTLGTNPIAGMIMAMHVFVVYGSIMGLAFVPMEDHFSHPQQRHDWIKYPTMVLLMIVSSALFTHLVALSAATLGLVPERRPIYEHPFF